MKVGDLIQSKNRYTGRLFLVLEIRDSLKGKQLKAISLPDRIKTRWCKIDTWDVISEV